MAATSTFFISWIFFYLSQIVAAGPLGLQLPSKFRQNQEDPSKSELVEFAITQILKSNRSCFDPSGERGPEVGRHISVYIGRREWTRAFLRRFRRQSREQRQKELNRRFVETENGRKSGKWSSRRSSRQMCWTRWPILV